MSARIDAYTAGKSHHDSSLLATVLTVVNPCMFLAGPNGL